MVLELPALAEFLFAVVGGALGVGASVLLRGLAASLAQRRPLSLTQPLGQLLLGAGSSTQGWITDNTKQYFHGWANWLHTHANVVHRVAQSTKSVLNHLGDQIAHIVTQEIPNAQNRAQGYSDRQLAGAVAGVEADIRAAATTAANNLRSADRTIYGVIHQDVVTLEGDITAAVKAGVDKSEDYTDGQISALRAYVNQQVKEAEDQAADDLARTKALIGSALAAAAGNANDSITQAGDAIYDNTRDAAAAAAAAQKTATAGVTAEQQFAGQVGEKTFSTAGTALEQQIGQAQKTATGAVTAQQTFAEAVGAESFAQAGKAVETGITTAQKTAEKAQTTASTAETAATSALSAQEQFADEVGAKSFSTAGTAITNTISQTGQAATSDLIGALSGVASDVTGQAQAAAGDLTNAEALLATAITGAIASIAVRVATLEDCAVRSCAGKNNLGDLLKTLIGVADFAAFAAFVEQAINDPKAAGAAFAGDAQTLYSDADSLLNVVLSI